MAVAFTTLKLKLKSDIKKITIADKEIEVIQYLPAEDKNSILELTIQEADRGTVVNTFALDCLFHLYIIFKYTNISFTEKQREDEAKLYDTLLSSGLLDMIINAIPEDDYKELKEYIEILEQKLENNEKSMAAKLSDFMEMLPDKMKEAAEIAEKFDPKQFQNVINFATAANGGRPIDFSKEDL